MDAFVFDAFEFCRLKERREGEVAVADLARLSADTADKSGTIRWALQGGKNGHGHPQLTLTVSGTVKLMCQRCLTAFPFAVDSEAVLVLSPDEESIDGYEMLIDDESVDVIVGSHAQHALELVEDEVLLALPLSPRHEVCPSGDAVDALKKTEKESPFAVLKNLKQ